MIVIRPEEPRDLDAVRAVLIESFPSDLEARIVDALRRSGRLIVSYVAIENDRVVGHVAFSPVRAESGAAGVGLAPVAVIESRRGRGVGSALIEAALGACLTSGAGWAVVLGDPAYYSRFGFAAASRFGLRDEYDGGEAFQALELREGAMPIGAGLVKYAPEFNMAE